MQGEKLCKCNYEILGSNMVFLGIRLSQIHLRLAWQVYSSPPWLPASMSSSPGKDWLEKAGLVGTVVNYKEPFFVVFTLRI